MSQTLLSIIGGLVLGVAWNFPNEIIGVILGWGATLSLTYAARSKRPYLHCYLLGLAFHPLGFHWLMYTISHFGGFPIWEAALIFALYCTLSSVQFLLFPLFYQLVPKAFRKAELALPIGWCLSEFLAIKIFPWHLGHTQLGALPFVQVADIGGSILVSGLMIWIVALITSNTQVTAKRVSAFALLVAMIAYGLVRMNQVETMLAEAPKERTFPVALVQANISLDQKHDRSLTQRNRDKHLKLSEPYAQENTLIIWPETAIMEWIDDDVGHIEKDPRLPFYGKGEQWLVGGLTFQDRKNIHNSIIAVRSNGDVPKPYHKKILMPFGEYTPLGDYLPWLKAMNATAADFTPGKAITPHTFQIHGKDAKVASLICYEDIVTSLGKEAIEYGAELLVNQTNDGWFGDTIAPYQHHVLAAFRAIENRRFLLRATNSGLTAIVAPNGRTTHELPPFSEGVIHSEVTLLSARTPYNSLVGDYLYWFFTILICYTILRHMYFWTLKMSGSPPEG